MKYTNEMIAELAGDHMNTLDSIVMDGVWPIVDGNGWLTGSVTDCDDGRSWILVDWDIADDRALEGNTCAMLMTDWDNES